MRPSGLVLLTAALLIAPMTAQGARRRATESSADKAESPGGGASGSRTTARPEPDSGSDAAPGPKGPQRVDFDDRLLQGQSNRLGAVYLYQRKEPAQPSLLDRHKSFRGEIRRDLLE
jgi:hypothetical protein